MEITYGAAAWRLEAGDCLALPLDQPNAFHNPGATRLPCCSTASKAARPSASCSRCRTNRRQLTGAVLRSARKRGVGALLMQAAEEAARDAGKTLLVLDTSSTDAARLYARMGWLEVGVIPGYALWPQGGLCDTTYFYRALNRPAASAPTTS